MFLYQKSRVKMGAVIAVGVQKAAFVKKITPIDKLQSFNSIHELFWKNLLKMSQNWQLFAPIDSAGLMNRLRHAIRQKNAQQQAPIIMPIIARRRKLIAPSTIVNLQRI